MNPRILWFLLCFLIFTDLEARGENPNPPELDQVFFSELAKTPIPDSVIGCQNETLATAWKKGFEQALTGNYFTDRTHPTFRSQERKACHEYTLISEDAMPAAHACCRTAFEIGEKALFEAVNENIDGRAQLCLDERTIGARVGRGACEDRSSYPLPEINPVHLACYSKGYIEGFQSCAVEHAISFFDGVKGNIAWELQKVGAYGREGNEGAQGATGAKGK